MGIFGNGENYKQERGCLTSFGMTVLLCNRKKNTSSIKTIFGMMLLLQVERDASLRSA